MKGVNYANHIFGKITSFSKLINEKKEKEELKKQKED